MKQFRSGFFSKAGSFFSGIGSALRGGISATGRFISSFSTFSFDMWKLAGIAAGAVLLVLIIIGTFAFFLSLEGNEQTMVPEVVGKDLPDAILELQENSLVPFLQKRFSSDPALKGTIVSQEPHGGTLVKAGKRIKLVVSMGAIIDRVGNYVGQDLNEVRVQLQTLFVASKPLLRIKEPVVYVFSSKPAGTILEQKPKPDTEVADLTDIELVVSRGSEVEKVTIGSYVGLEYAAAIRNLAGENIPFSFSVRPRSAGEAAGVVVSQIPATGEEVPVGTAMQLEITEPSVPQGYVKGFFEYALPDYFVMVDLKLETISPAGERRLLFSMKHPGGSLSVPYVELPNTVLVLTVQDREIIRHVVSQTLN